ncbi:helix-turn-helix transcriptional regulator [Marinobacterium arenosum]|uniref:helix-turn-helix transcriptional regulator n=1 Tax=Marinobacterium arenosum TaxID=2862496 RepID=UPI001C95DFFB|nr:YafY family protein [Marinobacterium arenosum]MBY4675556.1 YafY family transcriptional regulator [Marinobacterium arenosum]
MRKAERLFQIITLLRGRRTAMTAQQLAEVLEVSLRTLYRDVQALQLAGVPVEGEAGVGYRLRPGYQLPPLMFEADELLAQLVGLRMVRAFTDPQLAAAARSAEHKVRAILPEHLQRQAEQQPYRVPVLKRDEEARRTHAMLRKACERCQCLTLRYRDLQGEFSERLVYPLALIGWRHCWTLLAWCELRRAYRNFRLDRILEVCVTDRHFETHHQLSLQHYLATELAMDDFD